MICCVVLFVCMFVRVSCGVSLVLVALWCLFCCVSLFDVCLFVFLDWFHYEFVLLFVCLFAL